MLRTALFAATVFAASLSPAAFADVFVEGRVVAVAPNFSLSFGSRYDDFRIDYVYGGERYVTYRDVYPGDVILVPPPVALVPVGPRFGHRHWRHDDRWGDRWDDRRHWRDDRHGHRHGHRHHHHDD